MILPDAMTYFIETIKDFKTNLKIENRLFTFETTKFVFLTVKLSPAAI